MTFLRNIGADLVEKRLWPLAVALLVGLVAVPTLLAKSASKTTAAPAAPIQATAAAKGEQALVLDTAPAGRRKRGGAPKNPFVQLFVPKPAPVAAAPQTSTTGDKPSSGGDSGKPVEPKPKSEPKPKLDVYEATLRFGEAGAMRTIRDIPRLTPLPSVDDPFFVFLGVKSDGNTLVFLVSSDAKATGDGKCQPAETCETIEMEVGDTEFFDLVTDVGLKQYQMDVVSISKEQAASAAAARKARARQSKAGAALLAMASDDSDDPTLMGRYRWNAARGVLEVIPRSERKAKAAVKAIAGTASVP